MQGLHLTADLYDCRCPRALLTDSQVLKTLCATAVSQAGLTRVGEMFHGFPSLGSTEAAGEQSGGVTGAVLLAQSHLAIHTWPEHGSVTLDVYVCNVSDDNSSKAEALMSTLLAAFQPVRERTHRLQRGSVTDPADAAGHDRPEHDLLLEWLNPHSAYGFRMHRKLETIRSPHQTIEVFDTPQFGKLFRLDGSFMTSEGDEFFYHEPLVHCAALAHLAPCSALVLGGGDGGSTEELLKHPSITRVVMAELDQNVIDVARRHLGSVHRGVLDDPRLQIVIGDGLRFAQLSDESFDLIVLDLTDPETPADRLYSAEFFELARSRLAPGGAITLHIGSPVYAPQQVARIVGDLKSVFRIVRPLGLHVPLYGSYWGMAVASESLDPLAVDVASLETRLRERRIGRLSYYNPPVHHALFTLPNFFLELLGADLDASTSSVTR